MMFYKYLVNPEHCNVSTLDSYQRVAATFDNDDMSNVKKLIANVPKIYSYLKNEYRFVDEIVEFAVEHDGRTYSMIGDPIRDKFSYSLLRKAMENAPGHTIVYNSHGRRHLRSL